MKKPMPKWYEEDCDMGYKPMKKKCKPKYEMDEDMMCMPECEMAEDDMMSKPECDMMPEDAMCMPHHKMAKKPMKKTMKNHMHHHMHHHMPDEMMCEAMKGHMPENTCLAHAFVPWQCYERAFCPEEALMKGTLFPELWGVYPIPE